MVTTTDDSEDLLRRAQPQKWWLIDESSTKSERIQKPNLETLKTLDLRPLLHRLATFQATTVGGDGLTNLPSEDPPLQWCNIV